MPRVKANLVPIMFITGLSLKLRLPSTQQPQRRLPLRPDVEALRDLQYGKASGTAMLIDLCHSSWNTQTL